MTKDIVLKMLKDNKDSIMVAFKISDEGIQNVETIIDMRYANLGEAMDGIFSSNLDGREKMVAYYLVGYVDGVIKALTTNEN